MVEKKITAHVYNHTLAKSLFRMVTEDQVFHYQNTVTPMVLNHADNRETIWRAFCRKVNNYRLDYVVSTKFSSIITLVDRRAGGAKAWDET